MIDKNFIEKQRSLIEQRIDEITNEIKQSQQYDDLGSSDEDKTQEFEEFEGKNAISIASKKELEDLKCALGRIEEGKYGICAKCGQPIEEGRLKAYLGVIYCSTHASER